MKRRLITKALCTACVLFGLGGTFAKKQPEKPVQERFGATISPAFSSDNSVTVAIQEFSTDEEVQALSRSFAAGGQDAVEKALDKTKKGYFRIDDAQTMPLLIVQSWPEGAGRRLHLVGRAPTSFGMQNISIGHRGSPYTCIQLEVNWQGNGKGMLLPYANLEFNQQGEIVVKPMAHSGSRLVNVHLEK